MRPVETIPRVTKVEPLDGHRLRLAFKDGLRGDVDLSYLVGLGPIFEPLRDLEYFRRVRVDRAIGTIVWPNGADVAPETLHQHVRKNTSVSNVAP
jgi:hypothetical protein